MKTRKCIMKAGNLDNYLLNTSSRYLDSKMGLYLKSLIKDKQKNPDSFKMPYIPGSATLSRSRKTQTWEYRQIPTMYTPAHIRQNVDLTEFYEKPPSQMSRYELQELEQALKEEEMEDEELSEEEEEVVLDEHGNPIDKEVLWRQTDEYKEIKAELLKLQPMKVGVYKRYWDKFKYNKARREHMIELFDNADEQTKYYLQEEYVNWRDEIPGVRDFLKQVQTKKVETKIQTAMLGNTIVRTIPGKHSLDDLQEVQYTRDTFNPFDQLNIKTQEKKIRKVIIERDTLKQDDEGLTLGSTETEYSTGQSSEGDHNEGKQVKRPIKQAAKPSEKTKKTK